MQMTFIVTENNIYKRTKEIIFIKHFALSQEYVSCSIHDKGRCLK